jgi:hypothetical protein
MTTDFIPPQQNASNDPGVVFDYEIYMYFGTRRTLLWVNEQLDKESPWEMLLKSSLHMLTIRNSVVESMIPHTRIVTEILISKRKYKDDKSI